MNNAPATSRQRRRGRLRTARAQFVLALGSLIVAGCASPPPKTTLVHDWAMVQSPTANEPVTTLMGGSNANGAAGTADGAVAEPVVDHAADVRAAYGDVLDRMRAEYSLPAVPDARVARQIDYFLARTELLDRMFERAERYLYYVVTELEARQMPIELAL